MTRSDIHRPSAPEFDPEGYIVLGFADFHATDGYRPVQTVSHLVDQGWSFRGAPHGGGQCSHCGAHLRYAALMGHEATKTLLYVGETCLENRFESTAAEFAQMRAQAAAKAERSRREGRATEWLRSHPEATYLSYAHNISVAGGEVEWSLGYYTEGTYATKEEAEAAFAALPSWQQEQGRGYEPMSTYKRGTTWDEKVRMGDKTATLIDMWGKIARYGSLSDNALAYAMKIMTWLDEAEQRRAAREVEAAAKKAEGVEVPSGKVTVEGTVVSVKSQDTQYGTAWKMLVQHEDGWKVFGTIPQSLLDSVDYYADLKGKQVRFTATVEQSRDDSLFGFYKRPTKAQQV